MHAPNIKHGQVSLIEHDGSGLFVGLPPGFDGVQYNSLVVNPDSKATPCLSQLRLMCFSVTKGARCYSMDDR